MIDWHSKDDQTPKRNETAFEGWPRTAGYMLFACMLLLATAAIWLLLTRPVHRTEGDFLKREDQLLFDDWLIDQLSNPIAELRARAYLALARIQGTAALQRLGEATIDPAPSVRAQAAFSIGVLLDVRSGNNPNLGAADALLTLLEDGDRIVVTRAVEALGKMQLREAAVRVTQSPAPIVTTMTALIRMQANEQHAFITEYLDSDDQDSRWAAALAADELKLLNSPAVWKRLERLLTDDNDYVRAVAVRSAAARSPGTALIEKISKSLDHKDPKVRFEAEYTRNVLLGAAKIHDLPTGEPPLLPDNSIQTNNLPVKAVDYQKIARTLGSYLLMSTSLGDFEIKLDYEHAPLTAEHFRQRAIQGAFDGIRFTTVRPNGYALASAGLDLIRPELNPLPFLRGSVGLLQRGDSASAWEFFLCQTALPLADSRYVNFGRLVSGDRLLDHITQDIRVHSIRMLP